MDRQTLSQRFLASMAIMTSLGVPLACAEEPVATSRGVSIGAYFASGTYGANAETEIRYFPVSYEASFGKWSLSMMLPYLEVTGLGNVLVNVGEVTRAVAGIERTTSGGVGDVIATAIYRLEPQSVTAPFIDLRLDMKLPTADEDRGLGTGEVDYSLQLDFSKNVGDGSAFATIGFSFRGKSDLYQGLRDGAFAQVGMDFFGEGGRRFPEIVIHSPIHRTANRVSHANLCESPVSETLIEI